MANMLDQNSAGATGAQPAPQKPSCNTFLFDTMPPPVTTQPADKKIEGQTRLKPVTQSHRTKALAMSATSAGPPDSTDKIGLSALS
jgi:hypothetical protein